MLLYIKNDKCSMVKNAIIKHLLFKGFYSETIMTEEFRAKVEIYFPILHLNSFVFFLN